MHGQMLRAAKRVPDLYLQTSLFAGRSTPLATLNEPREKGCDGPGLWNPNQILQLLLEFAQLLIYARAVDLHLNVSWS